MPNIPPLITSLGDGASLFSPANPPASGNDGAVPAPTIVGTIGSGANLKNTYATSYPLIRGAEPERRYPPDSIVRTAVNFTLTPTNAPNPTDLLEISFTFFPAGNPPPNARPDPTTTYSLGALTAGIATPFLFSADFAGGGQIYVKFKFITTSGYWNYPANITFTQLTLLYNGQGGLY
jgi:hypothetical protein